jgi:hypothetical protein
MYNTEINRPPSIVVNNPGTEVKQSETFIFPIDRYDRYQRNSMLVERTSMRGNPTDMGANLKTAMVHPLKTLQEGGGTGWLVKNPPHQLYRV